MTSSQTSARFFRAALVSPEAATSTRKELAGRAILHPPSPARAWPATRGHPHVAMLLEYLGHTEDAARVNAAVAHCLTNDLITPELGGSLSTKEVGDAVLAQL